MEPTDITGANRVFTKPPNWDEGANGACVSLPVRVERFGGLPAGAFTFSSAWRPSADELAALNAGGSVVVTVVSVGQPPLSVGVEG